MSTAQRASPTEKPVAPHEGESHEISGVHVRRQRVLIADDDPSFLTLVERFLSNSSFTLHFSRDGREALEAIDRFGPHILLADIGMPHLDGIALAREARQLYPDIQVVLMTANPDVDSATTAVELGACRYLSKPFRREELVRALEQASSEWRKAEESRSAMGLLRTFEDEKRKSAELRAALSEVLGSLWIAYQPIVRAKDGGLYAHEALLRSNDARLPSPMDVIQAAEHLGAVHDLGRVVRARAMLPVAADTRGASLFVNLHPRDLLDEDLLSPDAPLTRIASRVVLEITERATLDDIPDLLERVSRLRAMGFRMAVDDLGAGYATMYTIVALEPEVVKLDMSLVRNVHESRTKTHIVRHLVGMTHDSGGLVVAEGVETEQERAALIDLECDFLQGYLIGRPAKWAR